MIKNMKDNRIKEEMEEEIVCNRWKDLADCLIARFPSITIDVNGNRG